MPKQNSVLKVKGKLDDVSYYKSGDKLLARKASGPSKSRLERNPRMNENINEFTGTAVAAKELRTAFSGARSMFDSKLSQRLTALLRQVMKRDIENVRGERSIQLSADKAALEKFEFNIQTGFSQVCTAAFEASMNAERNEGLIKIPAFEPGINAIFPKGTTHCRFMMALGVFSDYQYNGNAKKYLPANAAISGKGIIIRSGLIAKDALPLEVNLSLGLAGAPVIDDKSTVIQCLGIEFYETIGARQYLFAQNNAMVVVKVA